MSELVIATAFSPYPAGRTNRDGPNNGTRFRKEFLVPALAKATAADRLRVTLDGCRSFGSSFLEEAFGGLVREEGYTIGQLSMIMEIVAVAPVYATYKRLIAKYLDEATTREATRQSA